MLASDLACALDPVHLAAAVGIHLDPWQRQVVRSSSDRLLLNTARQTGKSTVSAVLAVHQALYEPGSLTLLLSPALRQSTELFRKCLDVYRGLERPVPAEAETRLALELSNGSRILSLPGKEGTIRGYAAARLIVVDEASLVPDELYFSVRPMLAVSGGRLVAPSTPRGKRGWWHAAWTGEEDWDRYEIPATACKRIPAAFLEEERRALGEFWYRQEYECEFMDTVDQLFSYEAVMGALSADVQPLFGGNGCRTALSV